jgi:hypothetical protein
MKKGKAGQHQPENWLRLQRFNGAGGKVFRASGI